MEKMLGIINPDGYEKVNRVYSISGDCPTLQSRDYKDPIKILDTRKVNNTMAKTRQDKTRQDKTRHLIAA